MNNILWCLVLLIGLTVAIASPKCESIVTKAIELVRSAAPEKAVQRLRTFQSCPHAKAVIGIALLQHAPPKFEEAVELLESYIKAVPTDWIIQSYLGASYELLARRLVAHTSESAATPVLRIAVQYFSKAVVLRHDWLSVPEPERVQFPHGVLAQPPTYLYRSLGDTLQWMGRSKDAFDAYASGVADPTVGWVTPWARPLIPLPLLLPHPVPFFFATGETSKVSGALTVLLQRLQTHIPIFQREFFAIVEANRTLAQEKTTKRPLTSVNIDVAGEVQKTARSLQDASKEVTTYFEPEDAGLHSGKQWSVLVVSIDGEPSPLGCSMAPETCSILQAEPFAVGVHSGQAKFSVLRPGVHVKPHAGPTNARLRIHCTLSLFSDGPTAATFRVGTAQYSWRHNECFAFDESFEHEVTTAPPKKVTSENKSSVEQNVENEDTNYRAVLLIDIVNPFLASIEDVQRYGVSDSKWSTVREPITNAWRTTKEDVAAVLTNSDGAVENTGLTVS